jgi:hypothetical protein
VALPPVKRYAVHLRWRSRTMGVFSWRIDAIAKNSAALVAGLVGYMGPGVMIAVKAVG